MQDGCGQLFGVVSCRMGMVLPVQVDVVCFLWVWAVYWEWSDAVWMWSFPYEKGQFIEGKVN